MSKQLFYAVGINREKLPEGMTTNPDCHFDPTKVAANHDQSFDAGDWAVSPGFATITQAKIMASLGQRALFGSQDFFVMEHTDGVPTGYYALPRICTDDELDEAVCKAIMEMPDRIIRRALSDKAERAEAEDAKAKQYHVTQHRSEVPPVQVVFVPRRSSTEQ